MSQVSHLKMLFPALSHLLLLLSLAAPLLASNPQSLKSEISFADTCNPIRYNHLNVEYQLTLPLQFDVDQLEAQKVTLSRLVVRTDSALSSQDSQLSVLAKLTKPGHAQLIFLCETFSRCQELKDELSSSPELLQESIEFIPVGVIGDDSVIFNSVRSSNLPRISCPVGQWVAFQRRVDGSLPFSQNWETYVKGFGNPDTNYWMGLEQISAMTLLTTQKEYARCQLRIEVEDFDGHNYWGQYKNFQVLGAEFNYKLYVGDEVSGSLFTNFVAHVNDVQFSTFDKDNDAYAPDSCSQRWAFGGWWFKECGHDYPNGVYKTETNRAANEHYTHFYCSMRPKEKTIPMKKTLFKFRCD